jgi:hypothetical protein
MSAEVKFLIPSNGQIVRDPMSKQILPVEGMVKPWIGPEGRYWRRRANDGSVIVLDERPKVMDEKIMGVKNK